MEDDKNWIPACAEKRPSHWKEMLGGMTDGRPRGEVLVSCYTFLETSIGCYHALGLPWTRQR